MTEKLSLVRLQPGSPSWNMAVDEALLMVGTSPLLRFYSWRPFGLSLGHFQAPLPDIEAKALAAQGIEVVHRLSGGGAILHAHEITYSLSGPDGQGPFAGDVGASYDLVHGLITERLREQGLLDVGVPESAPRALKRREQPFLCFARSTSLDLVASGAKVVGSAKRRRGGRALQHGSIVLRRHPQGGDEPGIEDILGRALDLDLLQDRLAEGLAAALGVLLEVGELPETVLARARAAGSR